MNAILYLVCVILGLASLAFIAALSLRRQFADFHELVRRTPPLRRTLLALLAAAFIAYGGGKTNQVEQTGATNGVAIVVGGTNVVDVVEGSENEIASCGGAGRAALPSRVSAMPSPVSCLASSAPRLVGGCAMTGGAVLASNWWLRGCWEDCSVVRLFDWVIVRLGVV